MAAASATRRTAARTVIPSTADGPWRGKTESHEPVPPAPALELPHYGIGFGGAVRRGFVKYARFSGRASRSEYWWWVLFTFLVFLALGLFYFGVIVPTLAVTVRRLHDAGFSGWLVLLTLIPWLGSLVLLVFALMPSSPNGVRYDPPPGQEYGYR